MFLAAVACLLYVGTLFNAIARSSSEHVNGIPLKWAAFYFFFSK